LEKRSDGDGDGAEVSGSVLTEQTLTRLLPPHALSESSAPPAPPEEALCLVLSGA
jgi:hypothetical protein